MTRKALLLLSVLTFVASAHAQFSLYGSVTLDHLTGINTSPILATLSPAPCTGTNTISCTSYKDSVNPVGFTTGVSWDFKQLGPALLTADVRAVYTSAHEGAQSNAQGSGSHIYSYLGGVRASFHTPISILRPYVQGSLGYARSNYGVLTNAGLTTSGNTVYPGVPTQGSLEYHGFAGVDMRVLPILDWRVAEVGFGALQSSGNFGHTYPLYTITTGVVFHFPPRQ
jgi:hypothetical protein